MSTFTVINEAAIVRAVEQCSERLVYIAPGITEPIVRAMGELMARQPLPSLTVIIDTDPEVCRLGYGTVEGLKSLQFLAEMQMLPVRFQPGLRVGVLVCDEQLSIYSPTPLLIEAGSNRADQPNALNLGKGAGSEGEHRPAMPGGVTALDLVLTACAAEGESNPMIPLANQAEIGARAASPALLDVALQDLARLPPKPYDVARTERVYNTKLQYVEFEVTGYKLAARRVQIPTDLLVGTDKALEARLRNTFSLLEGKESLVVKIADSNPDTGEPLLDSHGNPMMVSYSEKSIEEERKKIHADFLTPVTGHGQLIPKVRRTSFDIRYKWFESRVALFSVAVRESLAKAVETSVNDLTEALLPGVLKNPPARLMKHSLSLLPSETDFRDAVRADLAKSFNTGDRFFTPVVKVNFKDLTYETIKDEKFRALLNKAFPSVGQQGIFEEHDSAPELAVPIVRRAGDVYR